MVKIPKRIEPCPIVEAILEIRFSSTLPEDAIFGVVYNLFQEDFPPFKQLPILQLPAVLRATDQSLKFSPHYKTEDGNFILQLGPRSFSISNVGTYAGWDAFSKKIYSAYEKVEASGVM